MYLHILSNKLARFVHRIAYQKLAHNHQHNVVTTTCINLDRKTNLSVTVSRSNSAAFRTHSAQNIPGERQVSRASTDPFLVVGTCRSVLSAPQCRQRRYLSVQHLPPSLPPLEVMLLPTDCKPVSIRWTCFGAQQTTNWWTWVEYRQRIRGGIFHRFNFRIAIF